MEAIRTAHNGQTQTYALNVILEPDEDFNGQPDGWHAYCPELVEQGASTWGETQEHALTNIREVLEMVLESLLAHNEQIPVRPLEHGHTVEKITIMV